MLDYRRGETVTISERLRERLERLQLDTARDEGGRELPLGTRLAERFKAIGSDEEIPELCGEPPRPADFDS